MAENKGLVENSTSKIIMCKSSCMGLYVNDGKDFLIILEQLKIGFIKRVDNGRITSVKDLKSWRFER